MSTVTPSADLDHQAPPPPPTGPNGRAWAWWAGGSALLTGGLLTAAGGALRWWGPQRVADLTMRENDDANPLYLDPANVHPASGELVASGGLLVALGLLLFLFLPWRGWAARLLAYAALLSGVLSLGVGPLQWVARRFGVLPDSLAPGVEQRPDWWTWLNDLSSIWLLGAGPLLLAAATLIVGRLPALRAAWQRAMPVWFVLLLTSALIEYLANFVLFLSTSHDDPVGTHVTSGLAAAVAGVLAFRAARGSRAASGIAGPGSHAAVGDDLPRPRRSSLAWTVAGGLFVLSGVIAVVAVVVYPPELLLASLDEGPPLGSRLFDVATAITSALGYAALAAGPWRGVRRLLAVVIAVVLVAAGVVSAALALDAAMIPALTEPLSQVWSAAGVVQHFAAMGVAFVVFAVLVVWEQFSSAPLRGWAVAAVLITAVVALATSLMTEQVAFMEHPWPIVVVAPKLATVLVGLAWLVGAGRELRREPADGGEHSTGA